MRKGWISKNLGKCLTEYKHPRYGKLVEQFHAFATASQFDEDFHGRMYNDVSKHVSPKEKPDCSGGHVLYGITQVGRMIALKSVIDSSD